MEWREREREMEQRIEFQILFLLLNIWQFSICFAENDYFFSVFLFLLKKTHLLLVNN
jgi:hypothetical protein